MPCFDKVRIRACSFESGAFGELWKTVLLYFSSSSAASANLEFDSSTGQANLELYPARQVLVNLERSYGGTHCSGMTSAVLREFAIESVTRRDASFRLGP